jgi:prolyl-tRNA synthetase
MKMSQLFTKTRREAPRDEVSKNAQLLIRAGFINKEMAGVYEYLPLGLRVLNKISDVVREGMNAIGGQELQMTVLQNQELWERSGRWSDKEVDIWFKSRLQNDVEVGLGWSQEEPLTNLMREYITSYRDLPVYPYQIQTKFRNELRAKSGIMRGREFLMKDLYSFSRDKKEHEEFYEQIKDAYLGIYDRLGIGEQTYVTFASGGSFAPFSHEFQTVTDSGEDTIFVDEGRRLAVNQEVFSDQILRELGLDKDGLVEKKAIEVGNIFTLGTRFSKALDLNYADEAGTPRPVYMGCYGIGPSRVMGTIVELMADEKGMVWPKSVAPFAAHLVRLGDDGEVAKAADKLYAELEAAGVEVLYDDRDESAGAKFADADLIGVPVRLTVSKKTLEQGSAEWKGRTAKEAKLVKLGEVAGKLLK